MNRQMETCMNISPMLTLVLLSPDIPCLCKQCRSRSVGFWRSQLIWICTVCHQVCEFIATIRIKQSDWVKIRSGCGILIYSAGQGLMGIINSHHHRTVQLLKFKYFSRTMKHFQVFLKDFTFRPPTQAFFTQSTANTNIFFKGNTLQSDNI